LAGVACIAAWLVTPTARAQRKVSPARGTLRGFSSGVQLEGSAWERFGYAGTLYHYGAYGRDKIRAYGFNAQLRALLATRWKPRVTTQLTWGSGDGDPHDGVHGVFGGADIAFHGLLNVFYWPKKKDESIREPR